MGRDRARARLNGTRLADTPGGLQRRDGFASLPAGTFLSNTIHARMCLG